MGDIITNTASYKLLQYDNYLRYSVLTFGHTTSITDYSETVLLEDMINISMSV